MFMFSFYAIAENLKISFDDKSYEINVTKDFIDFNEGAFT